MLVTTIGFNFEEFDLLEHLLHLATLKPVKSKDLGDSSSIDDFRDDLLAFTQLYDFLFALAV